MKRRNYLNLKLVVVALASLAASCSVEDTHDLSKDVDMTVAVGNGISIPVGSTEQIIQANALGYTTAKSFFYRKV